ncbi:MAG: Type II secretion system protein E [Candidatus Adlerbacteria bacterium GW2011_GWA2_54_12]|nr:MAG: Type II secretion system protein E [Candidatus Adlerbacteria bacterium GW2011_GWA2_54_12]
MYAEEALRDFLIDVGLVSKSQMEVLGGEKVSRSLIERGILSEDELCKALAHVHGIPFIELDVDDISQDALAVIPEPLSRGHSIIGYRMSENKLEVALLDLVALEELEFLRPRYKILPRLTDKESIKRGLLAYQKYLRGKYGKALKEEGDPDRMARHLLAHALAQGASAAHLEPGDSGVLVRHRINGALRDAILLPQSMQTALEGIFPKDGWIAVDIGVGSDIKVRVARPGGGKIVLNLRGAAFEPLGFHGEALEQLERAVSRRHLPAQAGGGVAIEGEGKSMLLRTIKEIVSAPDISIADVGSSAAARVALKADPDVIFMNGMRDSESAALAASGAARGIFVVVAVEGGGLIGEALIVRQALARRLCQKQFFDKRPLSRLEQNALEPHADFIRVLSALKEEGVVGKETPWKEVKFARAVPCSECRGGYAGDIGLQEVSAGGTRIGLNLAEDGLFKSAQGQTSLEEVLSMLYDGR